MANIKNLKVGQVWEAFEPKAIKYDSTMYYDDRRILKIEDKTVTYENASWERDKKPLTCTLYVFALWAGGNITDHEDLVEDWRPWIKCRTCKDTLVVTENAHMCGDCEVCGNNEEREVPCPDCQSSEPDDFSGATEGDR